MMVLSVSCVCVLISVLCSVSLVSTEDNVKVVNGTTEGPATNLTLPPTDTFEGCFKDSSSNAENLSVGPEEYSRILIKGSHKFSLDLLRFLSNFESKDVSDGLLVSPFSSWSALIATYMGAKGDTEKEIRQVLQIDDIPKQSVGMSYQGLRFWYQMKKNSSKESNKKFMYSAANRIFVNDRMTLNECIKEHFQDEVQTIDYRDSLKATETINNWVSNITNGKIRQLVSSGNINPWTQLVIANGVYFQSQWLYKFKPSARKMNFSATPTEIKELACMTTTANLLYGVSDKLRASALELPYANQQFSMLILLPEMSRGLDRLIKEIQPEDIYEIVNSMYEDEVTVSMPKFKMEKEMDLAGPLYSMGIKQLFDPRFSNLSGFFKLTNETDLQNGVTVSSVIHKAMISGKKMFAETSCNSAFVVTQPFLTQFS